MTQYSIDRDKWSKLSIFEQMGNIYSEVGRAFKSRRSDNLDDSLAATYRAIDLFDITSNILAEKKSPKTKEILRAKEQFLDLIQAPKLNNKSVDSLDKYFLQFAIAARLNR